MLILALFANFLIGQNRASAALGGKEPIMPVSKSAVLPDAVRGRYPHDYFSREVTQPAGPRKMRVHEYLLPDGSVFAVSWRGIGQPDLSLLLGRYFSQYKRAAASWTRHPRRGLGTGKIRAGNLVLEKFGPMRDLRGVAYLIDKLPKNFHPEDFR